MIIIKSYWSTRYNYKEAVKIDDWIIDPYSDNYSKDDCFFHDHGHSIEDRFHRFCLSWKPFFLIRCLDCNKKLPQKIKKQLIDAYKTLELQKEL